jgi:DNA invertase Pin-like site-specific DNA recombinase
MVTTLAERWADSGTSTGRLTVAALGGLANVERDLIRTRTAERRSRTKAQGRHGQLAGSHNAGISTMRRATRAA